MPTLCVASSLGKVGRWDKISLLGLWPWWQRPPPGPPPLTHPHPPSAICASISLGPKLFLGATRGVWTCTHMHTHGFCRYKKAPLLEARRVGTLFQGPQNITSERHLAHICLFCARAVCRTDQTKALGMGLSSLVKMIPRWSHVHPRHITCIFPDVLQPSGIASSTPPSSSSPLQG